MGVEAESDQRPKALVEDSSEVETVTGSVMCTVRH
ncbi:MAG: hypothetical protein ACI8TP_004992 [Acidimicrobiales bacterium]|jgi:hypothetical protein